MTSSGHPYRRFQMALKTGNLTLIRAAAADLPQVNLADALRICWAVREDNGLYERACLRWIARFCSEAETDLETLETVVAAFSALPHRPEHSLRTLTEVCRAHGIAA